MRCVDVEFQHRSSQLRVLAKQIIFYLMMCKSSSLLVCLGGDEFLSLFLQSKGKVSPKVVIGMVLVGSQIVAQTQKE